MLGDQLKQDIETLFWGERAIEFSVGLVSLLKRAAEPDLFLIALQA